MRSPTISIPTDDQILSLQSLFSLMDDISREAEANGLMLELLDEILNEA